MKFEANNNIISYQKPNNFPQLITKQKWHIVGPEAADTAN